jgi:hypothetical protein
VNLISELLTKLDQWIDGLDVYSPNSRVSETPDRENYED